MAFPATRLRRLRKTGVLRDLVRETELSAGHSSIPLFVEHGLDRRTPIAAMPGIDRLSISARRRGGRRGRRASASPPCCCSGSRRPRTRRAPARGTTRASCSSPTRAIKEAHPELRRDHRRVPVRVHEPRPLRRPARRTAPSTTTPRSSCSRAPRSSQARAGADVVAPSDMMDGRVGCDPRRARRGRLRRHADRRLLGEVRLRLLRPVPRGRGLDAGLRRPPRLPDGPGQRARGACARRCSTSRRAPTS